MINHKTPKNVRYGEPYYAKRDNFGNKLSYVVYERGKNNKAVPIEYKYEYDSDGHKIAYYRSDGVFNLYEYDKYGDLIYEVEGSVYTGITTEHWYSGKREVFRRRVDAETMLVREHRNGVQTTEYYNPFVRMYSNPLCR